MTPRPAPCLLDRATTRRTPVLVHQFCSQFYTPSTVPEPRAVRLFRNHAAKGIAAGVQPFQRMHQNASVATSPPVYLTPSRPMLSPHLVHGKTLKTAFVRSGRAMQTFRSGNVNPNLSNARNIRAGEHQGAGLEIRTLGEPARSLARQSGEFYGK